MTCKQQKAREIEIHRQNCERRNQRKQRIAMFSFIGTILLIFTLGVIFGWCLGQVHAIEQTPIIITGQITGAAETNSDTKIAGIEQLAEESAAAAENLIVSEGNALSRELQKVMQEKCEEYDVPFALALAVAEQETRFDPNAVSGTNDYGLMQINKINFEWLYEKSIDPLTYEGNIEAGVLILSKGINRYGDYELALMAYNCGDTGAKRLWEAGTYSTKYSKEVLERYDKWTQILEAQ